MVKGKRPAELMTTGQAAKVAGVSRQALHGWIVDGLSVVTVRRKMKLRALKAYGRWMVDPADLAAWMKDKEAR